MIFKIESFFKNQFTLNFFVQIIPTGFHLTKRTLPDKKMPLTMRNKKKSAIPVQVNISRL